MATRTPVNIDAIREHMPVVCSDGGQFATVDHIDGNSMKLTRDENGQHHWIPFDWVTRVDQHVHVDRPGEQAMKDWSTSRIEAPAWTEREEVRDAQSDSGSTDGLI